MRSSSFLFALIFVVCFVTLGCGREPQQVEESRSETGTLQKCLDKACFPEEKEISGQRFKLTGLSSLIKYVNFTVYSAGFYLPVREDGIQVSPDKDAKILELYYHRNLEKSQVIESLRRDLTSMKDVKMSELEKRFGDLENAFVAPVKGDRYEFVFFPEAGTAMIHNGRLLTTIPGDDFGYAFFGVWISPDVEDQKMRHELLNDLPVVVKPSKKKFSEEFKKRFSKIGPSVRETSRKTVDATVETAKKLNPVVLGKKTWQWISRRPFALKKRVETEKPSP